MRRAHVVLGLRLKLHMRQQTTGDSSDRRIRQLASFMVPCVTTSDRRSSADIISIAVVQLLGVGLVRGLVHFRGKPLKKIFQECLLLLCYAVVLTFIFKLLLWSRVDDIEMAAFNFNKTHVNYNLLSFSKTVIFLN